MADNIASIIRNDRRAKAMVLSIMQNSAYDDIDATDVANPAYQKTRRKVWRSAGAPTIDAGSQATYPLRVDDWVIDTTNNNAYTCSVAPAASTAATFILMNATNA